ncbi:MAG: hypothetical protein IPK26_19925 [Planctomycetes bacterium]|nr:hypothetical protein [Planctomycetota bacterium]
MRNQALCWVFLTSSVLAQIGTIPGLDGRVTDSTNPTQFGRRGPAYPNGEVGMSYSYTLCNPGSVPIPWNAPMNPFHPMFAFMVVRESNGRLEQITHNGTTYVKHGFGAANAPSTCGGTCQSTGTGLRVNCTDTYGAGTNADRFWLGPASEIDPWTGIWQPIGSYFDRGDPDIGAPRNSDGVRDLSQTQVSAFDGAKNRVTLREQDLLVPGRLFYCMHIVLRSEDGDLHFDNVGHRQMTATWSGSGWGFANTGVPFTNGSVLNQWAGANVQAGRNGEDDGHFVVAAKVTGPVGGMYHYEYAVQNFDNARGGATFRVPVCPSATLANFGFRDPDGDPLNDWTASRVGSELVFAAPANAALDWNTIFNFWFDCGAAPAAGAVGIDQARLGAGALTVSVNSTIPTGSQQVIDLGPGCGSPAPTFGVIGVPSIPNPAFLLRIGSAPGSGLLLFGATQTGNTPWGAGCVQYLGAPLIALGYVQATVFGITVLPQPIPSNPALSGMRVNFQCAELVSGGPVLGSAQLSNGLQLVLGSNGCQ